MNAITELSSEEICYFQSLGEDKLKTVSICFQSLLNQLSLGSRDAQNTLQELYSNFRTWDQTEEGKAAWLPILSALSEYLHHDVNTGPSLIGRIQMLQNILPTSSRDSDDTTLLY